MKGVDGCAHCSAMGETNRWMCLSLVLPRQFTFSLPPIPLNYTNGVLVSAVRRVDGDNFV